MLVNYFLNPLFRKGFTLLYGGDKRRAAMIFLKLDLEWFDRLLKEPTRFSRQLALLKFLIFIGKSRFYLHTSFTKNYFYGFPNYF